MTQKSGSRAPLLGKNINVSVSGVVKWGRMHTLTSMDFWQHIQSHTEYAFIRFADPEVPRFSNMR